MTTASPKPTAARLARVRPQRPGWWWAACLAGGVAAGGLPAGLLTVPNGSFEAPYSPYANPPVDSWQKRPRPAWYIEDGVFYWDQLVGQFRNQPPASPDHIVNCHGQQALWVFAVPEVGLFQDYDSMDWNDPVPSHAFNVPFLPGRAYRLTVAVIGGGGNMQSGVPLELSLYYRDAAGTAVPVGATVITNHPELFPTMTRFTDFTVEVPPVKSTDPWAGRKLGIRLQSTVTPEMKGGYWDVDNVRLEEILPPVLTNPVPASNHLQFTLHSEPGQRCEVLAASSPDLPAAGWTPVATFTNTTGLTNLLMPASDARSQFYRARVLP